jgi:hypothetical protein
MVSVTVMDLAPESPPCPPSLELYPKDAIPKTTDMPTPQHIAFPGFLPFMTLLLLQ